MRPSGLAPKWGNFSLTCKSVGLSSKLRCYWSISFFYSSLALFSFLVPYLVAAVEKNFSYPMIFFTEDVDSLSSFKWHASWKFEVVIWPNRCNFQFLFKACVSVTLKITIICKWFTASLIKLRFWLVNWTWIKLRSYWSW